MFKVTNEEPRGMYLKSWSVLGINTKDKTINVRIFVMDISM
jgi:hypothetical protein